jgi:hypothetical protein
MLFLWRLSTAFSKSTKLLCSCLCHSLHSSIIFLRTKIWSKHPFPFQNPACSLLSLLSMAFNILLMIIFANILLGIDSRVVPLQLLQLLRSPFFGIFMIFPLTQSVGFFYCLHLSHHRG